VLLESMRTSETVNVLNEVSMFVAERLGLSIDAFMAVLRSPQQGENQELVGTARPFAIVTAQILKNLGGDYAKFAEGLTASEFLYRKTIKSEPSYRKTMESDLIEQIIKNRQRIAEKIYQVHNQLEQLLSQIQIVQGDSNALLSLERHIRENLESFHRLYDRSLRTTLNIGVIGQMRQGKSTFLQRLSGLTDDEIPAGRSGAGTAVRSKIYHHEGATEATVIFHSEKSFLQEVILPYYNFLGFSNVPTNLGQFGTALLPMEPDTVMQKVLYRQLKYDYQQNLKFYRDTLSNSPRAIRIAQKDLIHFVAEQRNEQNNLTGFSHLGVKEVNIYCKFPNVSMNKLGLIDLPGIGDTPLENARLILETLGGEIDIVIFIKRPDPFRCQWEQGDFSLYDLGYQVMPDLADRAFMLLNHQRSAGDNYAGCKILQQKLGAMKFAGCVIADCSDTQQVSSVLACILDYYTDNPDKLDKSRIKYASDKIIPLFSHVETVTSSAAELSEEISSTIINLKKALTYLC
jgi:uncharacterized protein YbcI